MYIAFFILFVSVLASGLVILMLPPLSQSAFKLLLAFGGSYLFAMMLVHVLPELFDLAHLSGPVVGLYILLGVFMQLFLDFFSQGVAHGHVAHKTTTLHRPVQFFPLVATLCIHALLDGVLLGMPHLCKHAHGISAANPLLLGIILHKIPVTLTLTSVLKGGKTSNRIILACLFSFALASPLSWAITYYLQKQTLLALNSLMGLYAISTGSLLHITTTLLFESNPDHDLNMPRLFACLTGALLAIGLAFLQGIFN